MAKLYIYIIIKSMNIIKKCIEDLYGTKKEVTYFLDILILPSR